MKAYTSKFSGLAWTSSVGALALALGLAHSTAFADPWKFGVISDTQWTGSPDDGQSPGTVPCGIIKQCNQAFIAQCVKFVIAVGDTCDVGSQKDIDVRALYAQELYNAGIGFYPFRGNHESGWTGSAAEEARIYPQIVNGGVNNLTPFDVLTSGYGNDKFISPVAPTGTPFVAGGNFSYPTDVNSTYGGLSYSCDYNNVRIVLIDQFENQNPGGNVSSAAAQLPWIGRQLTDAARPEHAFVFDHKNLLGGNHKDNIFGAAINGSDPGDGSGMNLSLLTPAQQATLLAKQQAEDAFITLLAANDVHFYISGHDHHHYDSIVQSPLSSNRVHQIISASDSSKFYTPGLPVSTNDTPVSQDLYKVGYYIYTVDGPRVTVDYYGVDVSRDTSYQLGKGETIVTNTPALTGNWQKLLTYGYSLNGQEFIVPEGTSYTGVADNTDRAVLDGETGYLGTFARILDGVNTSVATNNYGKAQVKAVDTGWAPIQAGLASDILSLWGMTDVGAEQTDPFVLLMSFDKTAPRQQFGNGGFGIATRDASGNWVNAVSMNFGGQTLFVNGPWQAGYPVGTYGADPSTKTAWAVLNYNGEFAVVTNIEPAPGLRN